MAIPPVLARAGRALAALLLCAVPLVPTAPAAAHHPSAYVSPYDRACPSGQVPEDGFTDVPPESAHEAAIDCAGWHGLTQGTTPSTFAPQEVVTRAQMASFVVRLLEAAHHDFELGEAPGTYQPPDAFDDDAGDRHERSINMLADVGLVRGTGHRRYSPTATVSREQMATYLVRAFEFRTQTHLPAARDRFRDDDGSTHRRAIDQLAGLRIASGTSATTFEPAAVVRREHMARFLVGGLGCMAHWRAEDGQYHWPRCEDYTETDGLSALQGFDVEVSTGTDDHALGQPVEVTVRACNRRGTPLRQVFPQRDWFVLQARHEAFARSGAETDQPDRPWYSHHWTRSLDGTGYDRPRDGQTLVQRMGPVDPKLAALTWYDGPQGSPDQEVVWAPGECKALDVGGWGHGGWRYSDAGGNAIHDYPTAWRRVAQGLPRTTPGWHSLQLHWGGVEVGEARRYLVVDASRFLLDGPRLQVSVEERAYRSDEQVPVTVSACNDADRPYREAVGAHQRLLTVQAQDRAFRTSEVGHVLADGEHVDWLPGQCRTWQVTWDQRFHDGPRTPGEIVVFIVSWNESSDDRVQEARTYGRLD